MKVLIRILIVIAILIAGLIMFVLASWDKSYDYVELPNISASSDSAMIARGKHLIYGPAHCATCHMPMDKFDAVEAGAEYPLMGGWELDIPPGIFRAPNLTPDETGIGKYSDGEIARALRHMVNPMGKAMFPFMPFQNISDRDLTSIISFLRSQKAVNNKLPRTELSFLGKALSAFGAIRPEGPTSSPPVSVSIDSTAEYGKYLARSVANCVGCHTERDLKTGEFIGVDFAGGLRLRPDPLSHGKSFITPNITPDKETGAMVTWNEDIFISRFKAGRIIKGSPMPWGAFSQMDTLELKAIYRFLQTIKPVENKIDKVEFAPGEEFPV
jgi:mono/diheme cytochrome c family protein